MPGAIASEAFPRSGVRDLYRCLWRYARGARLPFVFAMALLAGSMVLKLLIPWLAAQAINTVQVSGSADLRSAAGYVAAIFLVYVGAWALHGPGRILERNVGLHVRRQIADELYARLAALPLGWHEARHSGDIQQRADQAGNALFDFTQNQFLYVQCFINIVGPLAALWIVSGWIGALALVGYALIALVILKFDTALMRLAARENELERRYAATLLDFLGNISTVLSLRLEAASRRLLDGRMQQIFVPLRRSIALNEGKWCAVDLLSAALTWMLVGAFAWLTHRESENAGVPVLLGGLFMVYQYAQQAGSVIGSMASNFQSFARMRTDFASADPILGAASATHPSNDIAPDWTRIDVSGLRFTRTRAQAEAPSVLQASLHLRRGERIALVGPSGSGKSTLLRLLAGLYTPEHGYIQVDGEVAFGVRSLATISTLIPQEAEVFEATIGENLSLDSAATPAALERAMHVSALDTVIAALPAGLDTPISERGFNLSGGQRQRLALARGVVAAGLDGGRHGSVLLLDEPTSALDQVTEARVLRRLHEEMPDACIIASIHRLSALAQFDTVVLMQDGHVVDQGSYAELMKRQPGLREMVEHAGVRQGAA